MPARPPLLLPTFFARLRPRFTLRVLFAGVTLISILLALWTHRARQQRHLIDRVKAGGGTTHYDFQSWGDAPAGTQSPVPRIILNWLGEDYFHDVTDATVFDPTILPELTGFRKLESLAIANHFLTDESLAPIAKLKTLQALNVQPNAAGPALTEVGDDSLAMIATLPRLELAGVLGSRITPKGLEALARSKSLRHIQIVSYDSRIDAASAEPLRRAGRAGVHIQRWSPTGGGVVVAAW